MDLYSYTESFSKALFNYLWFTEGFISGAKVSEIFTKIGETGVDVLEFVSEVAKAVVVLSVVTSSSFYETMEHCFKLRGITRVTAFTLLAKFSFDNHAVTEDIFAVVLNTCTFVYMLVVYCNNEGHPEFVQFGAMCWTEIFEMRLKDEFHAKGGWEEFRTYVSENRFLLRKGDANQDEIVPLLEEIANCFPKLTLEPDQSCQNSPKTMANLESSGVEEVDKPQTSETAGFSFGTFDLIASNVPGFNEHSEACAEGVGKPQTNAGEAECMSRIFASNIPGYNGKSDCCVEGVDKPISGTVDLTASDIPGFNEKSKAVVVQFDNLNSKIEKLSEKYKLKFRGKPSLPAISPVFDTTLIEKNLACPSKQNTVDPYSIEYESKSEDIVFKSSTVETSTTIQGDSREEMVEANSCDGFDSDGEVAAPKSFSYIESSFLSSTFGRGLQEGMQTTDDQTTCEDPSHPEVESSDPINPQ